eukprot:3403016-Amphidinium_carterae.1
MEVTDENKQEYVQALCEARQQNVCSDRRVGPGDLSMMISGLQELDPEAWRLCTEVEVALIRVKWKNQHKRSSNQNKSTSMIACAIHAEVDATLPFKALL